MALCHFGGCWTCCVVAVMSKLTKEQLQVMSDKEINITLATLVFDAQGALYAINQKVTLSKADKLRQDCLAMSYTHTQLMLSAALVCG